MKNILFKNLILLLATISFGCATIVKSDKMSVRFMGGLKDGDTILNTPDGQYNLKNGQTTILISRSKTDIPISVTCNKETRQGIIETKYDALAGILGNIVFGGLIGMGIDSFNNKTYDPPASYNLSPLCLEDKKETNIVENAAANLIERKPNSNSK